MACRPCGEESVITPDVGPCFECQTPVCARISGSAGPNSHGCVCACGDCGVVCDVHYVSHARDQHAGDAATHCFPSEASIASARALRAASQILMDSKWAGDPLVHMPRYERNAEFDLSRFLNVVTPGKDTLLDLFREKLRAGYGVEYSKSQRYLSFPKKFFTQETVTALTPELAGASLDAWERFTEMSTDWNKLQFLETNVPFAPTLVWIDRLHNQILSPWQLVKDDFDALEFATRKLVVGNDSSGSFYENRIRDVIQRHWAPDDTRSERIIAILDSAM